LKRSSSARRLSASETAAFFCGIGNSIGFGISELVRRCPSPEVLFSPIKGRPRGCDVAPESVVTWGLGETLDRGVYQLPEHSRVTSRSNLGVPRSSHYALVCFSEDPIELIDNGPGLAFNCLRNLVSGKPVGASQVTAVVKREPTYSEPPAGYRVAFRARLVEPYFIRLRQPREVVSTGPS
jgi:hypothetical protein